MAIVTFGVVGANHGEDQAASVLIAAYWKARMT